MEITPKKEGKKTSCICPTLSLAEFAADNCKGVAEGPRTAESQGISTALGSPGAGSD